MPNQEVEGSGTHLQAQSLPGASEPDLRYDTSNMRVTMKPVRTACTLVALFLSAIPTFAQPLPNQVVRDTEHPQWLMRASGERLFLAGPGDPEDFLFRGTRLPDGTRAGDQLELIERLNDEGGNTLYVQAVRSHGGDGAADHNPFIDSDPSKGLDPDILAQWNEWFEAAEDAGVVIFFFVYDDSALIWPEVADIDNAERAFFTELINSLESNPNLVFFVAEESEEAHSSQHARELAELIVEVDDHDHLVGNHHHSGTDFESWQEGSALEVFGMQRNVSGDAVHHDSAAVYLDGLEAGSLGNAWMAIYAEAAVTLSNNTDTRRRFIWDAAMGGLQPLVYGMDVANTPDIQLRHCGILSNFMQATDVWGMKPADARAAGATRWVLANDAGSAILYTRDPSGSLGLTSMGPETLDLLWVDAVTGASAVQERVDVGAGTNHFARPDGIGAECAVWMSRSWKDLGFGLAGLSGEPELKGRGVVEPTKPITIELTNANPGQVAMIVIGTTAVYAPSHAGVQVPAAEGINHFLTGSNGAVTLSALWPANVPSGLSLYVQVWVPDSGAPRGYAASNAIVETTP